MTTTYSGRSTRDGLLRFALRLDAAASGAIGLAAAVAAGVLDGVLGIPAGWLVALGAFLVAWAGALVWLAARPRIPAGPAWAVVVMNLLWLVDSAAAAVFGWFPLTGAGIVLVVAQALGVLVFAELQYVGLRRARLVS